MTLAALFGAVGLIIIVGVATWLSLARVSTSSIPPSSSELIGYVSGVILLFGLTHEWWALPRDSIMAIRRSKDATTEIHSGV
jgi:hypothetical protein